MTGVYADVRVSVETIADHLTVHINGHRLGEYTNDKHGNQRLGRELVREIHERLEGPKVLA